MTPAPGVTFVNRFFHPDHSATSQLVSDLAFALAERGWRVTAVASAQRYDDPKARLAARERVRGVDIVRIRTTRFGRGRLAGRTADYVSFYFGAFLALLGALRRGDIVVAKTDPPLVSVVAALAARLSGARLVNWVQDLFPETAAALGVGAARGLVGAACTALRDFSLKKAAANVAIGEVMAARIGARGVESVRVIHNWADGSAIAPSSEAGKALRAAWGLSGFVAGYSGNLGRAHEVGTILEAAKRLGSGAGVSFLFIGDGNQRPSVEAAVAAGAIRASLQPYQPLETLGESLAAADVHFVTLKPGLEGLVVPSKFYAALAAARPVIYVGEGSGDVAELVRRHACGWIVRPGDAEGLGALLHRLASEPGEAAKAGRRGREAFEARYERRHALGAWTSLLEDVGRNPKN